MEQVVKLVGHLAWPATVLIILYVIKNEIRAILDNVKKRIGDPTTKVELGTEGLKLEKQLTAVASQVESLQIKQGQVNEIVLPMTRVFANVSSTQVRTEEKPRTYDIPQALLELANEYLDIDIADYQMRVREKNKYVDKMTSIVILESVSKDALVDSDHEGLSVALAGAVLVIPEKEDLERLLRASQHVKRLHGRYRIVLALTGMIEQSLVEKSNIIRIRDVLDKFMQGADRSLTIRIERTLAFIEETF